MRVAIGMMSVLCLVSSAHGEGPVGWLGIEMGPGAHGGVAVRGVMPGSPSMKAGVRVGDEVLEIAGHKVTSGADLQREVRAQPVGSRVRVKLARRHVDVELSARPDERALQRSVLLNQRAPAFEPHVVAGAPVRNLAALRGRVVLIDFFATWCAPCRAAMPALEAMSKELDKNGLSVIGISTEEGDVVAGAAARFGLTYPLIADTDGAISASYFVYGLPTAILLDRSGVVRAVDVADIEETRRTVERLLPQLPLQNELVR